MPLAVRIGVVLLVAIGVMAWLGRGPVLLLDSAWRAFCL